MSSFRERINSYSVDEKVVLGLVISVFISIYATAAMILFSAIYLIMSQRLKNIVLTTPGIKYIWVLCILGVVAALANNNGVGMLLGMLLALFFLMGAFARSVMTSRFFDKIIFASCAASIFSFAVALIQYVTFNGHPYRVCSVFVNANYYAAVIEMVVLFAVYKLCRVENRKQRGFYTIVIAMNVVGLSFSGCRTAVFVLIVSVSLMLLLKHRYKALAIFAGSCVLFAVLVITIPDVLPRMNYIDNDMGTRIEIWRRALEDIARHPVLGEGVMAFKGLHFVVNGIDIVHTHSIYLEPILSFGIFGTALIIMYLKKTMRPIWRMRNMKNDRDRFELALGLVVSIALHGIVDLTAFSVQAGILLMMVFAMAGIQENRQIVPLSLPPYYTVYLRKTG